MRWLLLAVTAACTPPAPCQIPAPPPPPPVPLAVTGFDPQLEVRHLTGCLTEQVTALVSVRDPNGDDVPSSVVSVTRGGGGELARISFVPTVPGPHHVVVRFEPNLGLDQLDVQVARDLRAAPAVMELDAATWAGCAHVDLLPSGRPICLAPPSARAGAVLWLSDGGELSRWVDTDAGLVRDPDTYFFNLRVAELLPSVDDVLVVAPNLDVRRVTTSDAGLSIGAPIPPLLPTSAATWAGWRTGATWLVLTPNGCEIYGGDGGLCPAVFGGTPRFLGTGPEGIVAATSSFSVVGGFDLNVLTLDAPVTIAAPAGAIARTIPEWDSAARFSTDAGIALVDFDGGFGFSLYGDITSSTSQWVTVRRGQQLFLLQR